MTIRRSRTVLLLESRLDWLPPTRGQAFGAAAGELATHRQECPSCFGAGNLNGRRGLEMCSRCHGVGSYLVDAYTGYRSSQEGQLRERLTDSDRRRLADAEIVRMAAQTARPTEVDLLADCEAHPFRWERERARYHRHGDYAALERALDWLGGELPSARHLVESAYTYRMVSLGSCSPGIVRAAAMAADALAGRLPDPIRVPHWLLAPKPYRAEKRRRRAA